MDDDSAWRSRPPDRELSALVDGAVHLPTHRVRAPVDRESGRGSGPDHLFCGRGHPCGLPARGRAPGTAWPA